MGQCHVLIVEDIEEIAEIEAAVVGRLGVADSTIVAGGVEAIDALRQQHFDLIILDLSLPDLPGQGVLDHLEENPDLRTVPVIVVSANVDDLRRTEQVAHVLVKPVDFFDLVEIITKEVDAWKSRVAAREPRYATHHGSSF